MITRVSRLGYMGIGVSDIDAWEPFATEILGMQVSERDDDGTIRLKMDDHRYRIALHPQGGDDVAYVGWQVGDEPALESIAEQLSAAGVAIHRGTEAEAEERGVVGLIKLADPSGIATEVFYGPQIDYEAEKAFVPRRPMSGFVTGDQGFGHFVVSVDDYDESLHFYQDLLGFRVSDYIRFKRDTGETSHVVFLHCNPRQHSIAFGHGPPREKRLMHFMLQTNSLDDVGVARDICLEKGLEISQIGRHPNDQMVSFYVTTPSGFFVEYGWGAIELQEDGWQAETYGMISVWGHQRPDGTPWAGPKVIPRTAAAREGR